MLMSLRNSVADGGRRTHSLVAYGSSSDVRIEQTDCFLLAQSNIQPLKVKAKPARDFRSTVLFAKSESTYATKPPSVTIS